MNRIDTHFDSRGTRCDAWLWTPDGPGPHPAIVLAHGSVCIKEASLTQYGDAFAAAGYVALAFSYRTCGGSAGEPRELTSLGRMRNDIRSALDFVRARPEVDPSRVALWGTSMGSGHVAVIASQDPRIAAAIVQCPVFDGVEIAKAYGLRKIAAIAPDIAIDGVRRILGRSPHYVKMVGRPGEKAMMSGAHHYEQVQRVIDEPETFANRVSAWLLAQMVLERPGRRLRRMTTPLLVCAVDRENIVDVESTVRAGRSAPRGEVIRYDSDHFDLYFDALNDKVVTDQIEFLDRHMARNEPQ